MSEKEKQTGFRKLSCDRVPSIFLFYHICQYQYGSLFPLAHPWVTRELWEESHKKSTLNTKPTNKRLWKNEPKASKGHLISHLLSGALMVLVGT